MAEILSLSDVRDLVSGGRRDFRALTVPNTSLANVRLHECDFRGSDLTWCDLSSCTFVGCRFDHANLGGIQLLRALEMRSTSFYRANLQGADIGGASFTRCNFDGADISKARLENVEFVECNLTGVSFVESQLTAVRFVDSQLADAKVGRTSFVASDITSLTYAGPLDYGDGPVIDWKTVCRSIRASGLSQFLTRAGMAELFAVYMIDCAHAIDPERLFKLMRSTFISYGHPDTAFARRLRDDLHRNGVTTFFFEYDAVPGDRLHRVMREGVNKYDRIILICSERSLDRRGVKNEIEETLAREARDGGAAYLIPVLLDDYLFTWKDPIAYALRDRVAADFRTAQLDRNEYISQFQRLLKALRNE